MFLTFCVSFKPFMSKRVTGFDIIPPASAILASAAGQATRNARRIYVSDLPPSANQKTVTTFFSHVMAAIGGNAAGPGDVVVSVYINHEKKFAFVEMRSVEEASNAMSLDGIIFEGVHVRVKRPSDYNPSLAAPLGPSQPNPNLNLTVVGLGLEHPFRILVSGLPYYFTEA
ncbi:putative RNA recognition motif domain, nucleotide-binding alpha-beta plait domain superfamily [Helianthus annuus]|nr:putative RNA recognition motif domain, nucleotide-binding alpha-beta plait domain superfamily [Helianthus annuus]